MSAPLIYVIAGEPSGDLLGGRVMASLRRLAPGAVRFAGIGGETMIAEGLTPLFPMADLSVMGLVEVLAHLPNLMRRIDETVEDILARRPDVVLGIDAPDFCFRVARRVSGATLASASFITSRPPSGRGGRVAQGKLRRSSTTCSPCCRSSRPISPKSDCLARSSAMPPRRTA